MIYQETIEIKTKKGVWIKNVTEEIKKIVEKSEITDGLCNIFLSATTAGLMINESEMMLFEDLKNFFKNIADESKIYQHQSNSFSHLRAGLLKPDITIPITDGKLVLGTWQTVLLFEFDVTDRKRELIVTVIGE